MQDDDRRLLGLGAPWRTAGVTGAVARFDDLVEEFGNNTGVTRPGATGNRGFGSAALRVDGSIFAMLSRGALVMKLPRERVTDIIASGAGAPFTAGKAVPMKEWVVVTTDDMSVCLALAREALAFNRSR